MATTSEHKPLNTSYEIFILALSLLSIFNLIVEILPIEQDVKNLVVTIDLALTPIFLFDFLNRLIKAPSKQGYLLKGGAGWILSGACPFQACASRDCFGCGAFTMDCAASGCGTSGIPFWRVVPRAHC